MTKLGPFLFERRTPLKKEHGSNGRRKTFPRRGFLQAGVVGGVAAAFRPVFTFASPVAGARSSLDLRSDAPAFELDEISMDELQQGMQSGKLTARVIAEKYLTRIDAIDKHGPALNSVIETNPDALAVADDLDKQRKEKGPRSPLHGIPILIKDNIDTADRMMTTAGSLALVGSRPTKDSFVAKRLR